MNNDYAHHPASPDSSPHSDNDESGGGNYSVKEQERFLPIANVSRIMKKVLPGNAKISKDAKETVQECVSEFISFITGEASDKCKREKRKTINGDDLLWAMGTLGFEDYIEPLKVYLQRYRETEGEKATVKQHAGGTSGDATVVNGMPASALQHHQQQQAAAAGYQRYNQVNPGYWMATHGSGSTSTGQPR